MRARRVAGAAITVLGALMAVSGATLGASSSSAPEAAPEPSQFSVQPSTTEKSASTEPASAAGPGQVATGGGYLAIPRLLVFTQSVRRSIRDQALEIPSDPKTVALYDKGGTPCGKAGTIVLAGHVSSYGVHGALWPLSGVKPGDAATLTCSGGRTEKWVAVSAKVYSKAKKTPASIWTSKGPRRLVVITCGGPVMKNGHYRDNVVVTFEPA